MSKLEIIKETGRLDNLTIFYLEFDGHYVNNSTVVVENNNEDEMKDAIGKIKRYFSDFVKFETHKKKEVILSKEI